MTLHLIPHPDPDHGRAALMALADSLEACSAFVDRSGKIVGVTEAWQAFGGQNPLVAGQTLGASYADACRDLIRSPDGNLSIVALGLNSVLEGRVHRLSLDYPYPEEDGPHYYGCTAVLQSASEDILAVVHIRDITHRASMEKRMRRSERLFKATTDNAMDFICLLDTTSQMVYHNPALQRFLGQSDSWIASQKMADLVHEADRDRFMASLQLGAKAGLTQVFEYRIADAHGAWIEMEGQVSMVDDPGGHENSVLLITRDISLRKQMERDRENAERQRVLPGQ